MKLLQLTGIQYMRLQYSQLRIAIKFEAIFFVHWQIVLHNCSFTRALQSMMLLTKQQIRRKTCW